MPTLDQIQAEKDAVAKYAVDSKASAKATEEATAKAQAEELRTTGGIRNLGPNQGQAALDANKAKEEASFSPKIEMPKWSWGQIPGAIGAGAINAWTLGQSQDLARYTQADSDFAKSMVKAQEAAPIAYGAGELIGSLPGVIGAGGAARGILGGIGYAGAGAAETASPLISSGLARSAIANTVEGTVLSGYNQASKNKFDFGEFATDAAVNSLIGVVTEGALGKAKEYIDSRARNKLPSKIEYAGDSAKLSEHVDKVRNELLTKPHSAESIYEYAEKLPRSQKKQFLAQLDNASYDNSQYVKAVKTIKEAESKSIASYLEDNKYKTVPALKYAAKDLQEGLPEELQSIINPKTIKTVSDAKKIITELDSIIKSDSEKYAEFAIPGATNNGYLGDKAIKARETINDVLNKFALERSKFTSPINIESAEAARVISNKIAGKLDNSIGKETVEKYPKFMDMINRSDKIINKGKSAGLLFGEEAAQGSYNKSKSSNKPFQLSDLVNNSTAADIASYALGGAPLAGARRLAPIIGKFAIENPTITSRALQLTNQAANKALDQISLKDDVLPGIIDKLTTENPNASVEDLQNSLSRLKIINEYVKAPLTNNYQKVSATYNEAPSKYEKKQAKYIAEVASDPVYLVNKSIRQETISQQDVLLSNIFYPTATNKVQQDYIASMMHIIEKQKSLLAMDKNNRINASIVTGVAYEPMVEQKKLAILQSMYQANQPSANNQQLAATAQSARATTKPNKRSNSRKTTTERF